MHVYITVQGVYVFVKHLRLFLQLDYMTWNKKLYQYESVINQREQYIFTLKENINNMLEKLKAEISGSTSFGSWS